MFISRKKHIQVIERLIKGYTEEIEHLKKSVNEAQSLKNVFERVTDLLEKNNKDFLTAVSIRNCMVADGSGYELVLPEDVLVYIDDIHGGKVIKQEATPVTVLDEKGKATYGWTKQAPDKNKKYQLIEQCETF